MKISLGTCTQEDSLVDGCAKLQPSSAKTQTQVEPGQPVRILCTQVQPSVNFCLLCRQESEGWDETLEQTEDEVLSQCLNTVTTTIPQEDDTDEWDALIEHFAQTSNVPVDLLKSEAVTWNKRSPESTLPEYLSASEPPVKVDEVDLDDLDWCGKVDRTATVLMNAAKGGEQQLWHDWTCN